MAYKRKNNSGKKSKKSNQAARVPFEPEVSKKCAGKLRYEPKAAKKLAKEYRDGKRDTPSGWCITAYRCPYCKQWHIGHAAGKVIRSQEARATHQSSETKSRQSTRPAARQIAVRAASGHSGRSTA